MTNFAKPRNDGGIIFGAIILGIGVLLLLRKLGIFFPDWLLTWPMILIVVGVFTLIKHEFQSFFGAVILAFGLYFLLERELGYNFGIQQYLLPIGLIALGIHIILKKKREKEVLENLQSQIKNRSAASSGFKSTAEEFGPQEKIESTGSFSGMSGTSGASFSDRVSIDAILSGVNKRVMSKNFQGGKLTAAFGGIDLDLTQADFNGIITLQIDVIFGGMKLIVPPHWDVRTEVSNIAAGVEDKRLFRQSEIDKDKVLVLKGTIFFGGLEIKSY